MTKPEAVDVALGGVVQGDALAVLEMLPSSSVDMVLTSPPFWGQRDYDVAGQLGLEPDFRDYLAKLDAVFAQVWRVLKPTGTCWVNLGDSYLSDAPVRRRAAEQWNRQTRNATVLRRSAGGMRRSAARVAGVKNKSLCNIPGRFAIQMTNRGWLLRNEIIWHKPDAAPQNVTDRFTVDFEKLLLFTKSKRYYFEQQFEVARAGRRNRRAVWSIPTSRYSGAHYATFPEALLELPIRAGCPAGGLEVDPFCGAGTTGLVAQRLGRRFLGIELNPAYVELARNRLPTG